MKSDVKLLIDQRGDSLRGLLVEGERILASEILPQKLDSASLQTLVQSLTDKGRCKPDEAHLLIATEQIKYSTYRLQEMPLADARKIISRNLTAATGETEPLFCLTHLSPEDGKNVFLVEQVPRKVIVQLSELFHSAKIKLAVITTALQAHLAAFAAHQQNIIQAEVIFDLSAQAITAIFLSPADVLHVETVELPDSDRESEGQDNVEAERLIKRRLFAVMNTIHSLYSQYMMANPLYPVEKVWVCGPDANIPGLEGSLFDAMEIEVAPFDLLAGDLEGSRSFTPLAGLIPVQGRMPTFNFVPQSTGRAMTSGKRNLLLGGIVLFLLIVTFAAGQMELKRLKGKVTTEKLKVQGLKTEAIRNGGRINSLKFLQGLKGLTPPLYPIFAQISERLPREIELDSITMQQSDSEGTFDLQAVTKHQTPWENDRIFTAFMASLDGIETLECKKGPDIAILPVGEERLIRISVSCGLSRSGGTQR